MRMRVLVMMVAVCASAAPAAAQMASGRLFGWLDAHQMTAKESFDAVAGISTVVGAGAGLEVHRVWRGVFLRGAFSRMTVEGERVFVFDGTVFPLGSPLDITMTPIDLAAGWRFGQVGGRVVPYVGAGASWLKYREDGDGSTSSETVKETYTGAVIFGGVDVTVWRYISAGAELAWRTAKVKNPGGAFAAFGEDDLGSTSVRVLLSIRR